MCAGKARTRRKGDEVDTGRSSQLPLDSEFILFLNLNVAAVTLFPLSAAGACPPLSRTSYNFKLPLHSTEWPVVGAVEKQTVLFF